MKWGPLTVATAGIAAVEESLDRHGLAATIVAPIGIVGTLVTLGVISGGSTAAVATRIIIVLVVLVLLVAFAVRNQRLRRRVATYRAASLRFARRIIELNGLEYAIREWKEIDHFSKSESTWQRWITIEATGDKPLELCWHLITGSEEHPPSPHQKRRIKVAVCEAEPVEGQLGEYTIGARLDILKAWEEQNLRIYVVLGRPLEPGHRRTLYVEVTWPEFEHPVSDGRVNLEHYTLWRTIDTFDLTVIFDRDLGLGNGAHVSTYGGLPAPTQRMIGKHLEIATGRWTPPVAEGNFHEVNSGTQPRMEFGLRIDKKQ